MIRILVALFLLVALAGYAYTLRSGSGGKSAQLPRGESRGRLQVEPRPVVGDPRTGRAESLRIPGAIVEVPPLPAQDPPAEFEADATVFTEVEDGRLGRDASGAPAILGEELPTEIRAIQYSFWRSRAGPPMPVDAVPRPEYLEFPRHSARLRGTRHTLHLQLIEEPQFRTFDENPSGVRIYWEAFAADGDGNLHRVLFCDNDTAHSPGDDVVVVADYLRLHTYLNAQGEVNIVPEWVARSLPSPPPAAPLDWQPTLWVAAICLAAFAALGLITLLTTGRRRFDTRRLRGRERASRSG